MITYYLGKNWGFFLGITYFIMLLIGMLTYSLSATFDSASYLQTFGLTQEPLSDRWWYGLLILAFLVGIAAQGERLIFKVSGPMVLMKLGVVVLLGVVMIPTGTSAISAIFRPWVSCSSVRFWLSLHPILHPVRPDPQPDERRLP